MSFIYMVKVPAPDSELTLYKVGFTRSPRQRMNTLRLLGFTEPVCLVKVDGCALTAEQGFHKKHRDHATHPTSEVYVLSEPMAREFVAGIEQLGQRADLDLRGQGVAANEFNMLEAIRQRADKADITVAAIIRRIIMGKEKPLTEQEVRKAVAK